MRIFSLFILALLSTSLAQAVHYAAGILPYTYKDGQCQVLLGQEPRYKWKIFKRMYWSDFGGRSKITDHNNIKYTAAREFTEETGAAYGNGDVDASIAYILARINNSYCLSDGNYTMYLVEVHYKNVEDFVIDGENDQEKIQYKWIPLAEIFAYIQSPRSLITSTLKNKEDKPIALYPKMSSLLESPAGISTMIELLKKSGEVCIVEDVVVEEKKGRAKLFIQKFTKGIKSILSFRPVIKLANLFK